MKEIILVKNGELALKGLNRSVFEQALIKNMRRRLMDLGSFSFKCIQSTINITPSSDDIDLDEAVSRLRKVFGIADLSRAAACEKDMDAILPQTAEYLADELNAVRTFKVEAKRSDKTFPLTSPQISARAGEYLLDKFPHLKVDVHEPDIVVNIEIRDSFAFIHGSRIRGAGGLPVGTSGKAALLISGGIDSPVAGWMTAKRGVELCAVHFMSPPYTSVRAEKKVEDLVKKLTPWCGRVVLYKVDFAHVQESIRDNCPEELFTVISRRFMMRVAGRLACNEQCLALVTGESIAQVASQTLEAIAVTDDAACLPVLRPCIGLDKNEIVETARKIDTFDISIEPYEDCCAIFTPKHPRTRPTVEEARAAEEKLDTASLTEAAAAGAVREVYLSELGR